MLLLAFVMAFVCVGMPLVYTYRVMLIDVPSKAAWLLLVLDATAFVALVLLLGRWDMVGYYTWFFVLFAFVVAVFWSARKHSSRPWTTRRHSAYRKHWTTLVSLALLGGVLAYVCYGLLIPEKVRELTFPLKSGRFMVGQAGNIALLNHHARHPEQRYAADITALSWLGFRATGIAPTELQRYEIYGASVVSPCTGKVVSIQNDLPDLVPPKSDAEHAPGNHVTIACGGFNVELAHLQPGSVTVEAGDQVSAGDIVGKVGNSGNTTEPHLHVHAVDPRNGVGIPMSFSGRVPVRNSLYVN